MSGRSESPRAWLRGVLVVVAIAAVAGVFGSQAQLSRPALSPVNIAGIAVMALGLAGVLLAPALAKKVEESRRDRAALAVKLAGVLVCGVGAILVFI